MLALHVSDLTGPSSGAFCTSSIRRLWYVVIRVLLDTSSRYKVVGRTGPMSSETCRANLSAEETYSLRSHCVSCWTTYILL